MPRGTGAEEEAGARLARRCPAPARLPPPRRSAKIAPTHGRRVGRDPLLEEPSVRTSPAPGPARPPRLLRVRRRPGAAPHLGLLSVAGVTLPCALGRAGLTRFKREGDGATPVGRFDLLAGRWRADRALPPGGPLPLEPIRRDDGWCDDPSDGRYNRPVRLPFHGSHEAMRRDDGLYDVVVVLDANLRRRVIGRGSAIFFHIARDGFEPTAGCVALRPADMRRVLARLGPRPVMVIG